MSIRLRDGVAMVDWGPRIGFQMNLKSRKIMKLNAVLKSQCEMMVDSCVKRALFSQKFAYRIEVSRQFPMELENPNFGPNR